MKIALTTIGSRGDIQPYISLGVALQQSGYSVAVFTHGFAKDLIASYNLKHVTIGGEGKMDNVVERLVQNSSNNLKAFKYAINFIFQDLRACHNDLLNKLQDYDIVIGHGLVGQSEAAMLKKPFIIVSLAPMGLEKVFWQSNNYLKELGIWLSTKLMEKLFGKPYARFRKEIGAPTFKEKSKFPYLALVPLSPIIQKSNRNWKPKTEITGFLYSDPPSDFEPPAELTNFIRSGEKPIFITIGSMLHQPEQIDELYQIISDAVSKSQSRAILLFPEMKKTVVSNESIFFVKSIPYSWLLKQVSLVVHHFGFGTTAEVLKAGLPSIPIPHIFDQNMRASKMYKMGFAHKPLNIKKLNSDILARAITNVKSNSALQAKCKETGETISQENGNRKAVHQIAKYIEQLGPGFSE